MADSNHGNPSGRQADLWGRWLGIIGILVAVFAVAVATTTPHWMDWLYPNHGYTAVHGDAIKLFSNNEVYVVAIDGQDRYKRHLSDWQSFEALGIPEKDIRQVQLDEFQSFKTSCFVVADREYYFLNVREGEDGPVKKRHISDGAGGLNQVGIPPVAIFGVDAEFDKANYESGEPITAANAAQVPCGS